MCGSALSTLIKSSASTTAQSALVELFSRHRLSCSVMGLQGYVGSGEDVRRIRRQEAKREKEKQQFEAAKKQSDANIDSAGLRKFDTGVGEAIERAFKDETAGLVTRAEFLNKRDTIQQRLVEQAQRRKREAEEAAEQAKEKERKKKAKKAAQSKLSFADDGEDDGEGDNNTGTEQEEKPGTSAVSAAANGSQPRMAPGIGKNPSVDTDFLPDRDREAAEERMRQQLRMEYELRQQAARNEPLTITYSYWDGAGHRRVITVRKGDTIEQFLGKVRDQLRPEFRELRAVSTSDLLYVKEDLIIPGSISFHDLIVGKARGKSGPLFHFDVHDDIRATNDASREKDESHAGKVVDRHWYNRNKHIFPASRWEVFDPEKQFDRYTVHGD